MPKKDLAERFAASSSRKRPSRRAARANTPRSERPPLSTATDTNMPVVDREAETVAAPAATPRQTRSQRLTRPIDYHYIATDLKHIVVTTAAMIAILVILAVIIR